MIPTIVFNYNALWSMGPMILFLLITTVIGFYVLRGRFHQTPLCISAFVAAIAGSVYTILVFVSYITVDDDAGTVAPILISVNHAFFVFYGLFISFTFIPGLMAFGRIAKQSGRRAGTCIVYVGYFWAFVVFTLGLTLTIVTATKFPSPYELGTKISRNQFLAEQLIGQLNIYNTIVSLFYYSNWAFIAALLLLHVILYRQFQGTARKSLVYYTVLNFISAMCFVITVNISVTNGMNWLATIFWCLFLLVDMPTAVALVVVINYSHLWRADESWEDKIESEERHDIENNTSSSSIPPPNYHQ